jgi:Na+-transporting methylmalonyl-CoA/oxaloacetate decarboxylase gamma subunit
MVSLVGLTITFCALLIFIGVILLLKALFPYKEKKEESEAVIETSSSESTNEEEIAAAIAAVIYLRGHRSNQLGSALMEGKSRFWTSD